MIKTEVEDKTRNLTVEFSTDALDMLELLRKKLNKKSKAEILRTALLLLNFVQEQRDSGYKLALTKDGEVKVVELLL